MLSASWCNPMSFMAFATSLQVSLFSAVWYFLSQKSMQHFHQAFLGRIARIHVQNFLSAWCQLLGQILSTWELHENEAGSTGYQDWHPWNHQHLLSLKIIRKLMTIQHEESNLLTSVDVIVVFRLKSYFYIIYSHRCTQITSMIAGYHTDIITRITCILSWIDWWRSMVEDLRRIL